MLWTWRGPGPRAAPRVLNSAALCGKNKQSTWGTGAQRVTDSPAASRLRLIAPLRLVHGRRAMGPAAE